LFTCRNLIHLLAGDLRDTLTAERQEVIAARLGYEDAGEIPGVETFMRGFYHTAGQVHHIANKILVRCLNSPLPLGSGLASVRRSVAVVDPREAAADPLWPLRALEHCQTYDLDLALPTEEAIQQHVAVTGAPTDARHAGALFFRLLSPPRNVYWAVRQMHNTGLLGWILPELAACMDLIPYDPAHEHTVGEHTLRVLRNLERLRSVTDGPLVEYRRLLEEVNAPEVLYLAALLHDIGKQWHHGRHAETGAEQVAVICGRLGYAADVADGVAFLVRHHLLMAETSRLRDLALDETITSFTRVVRDPDLLRMLYLLTYADTHAVGAGVWTEVKARFLRDLFERAEAKLAASGAAATPSPDAAGDAAPLPARLPNLAAFRDRVRRQLAREKSVSADAIHEHTAAMPAAYLLNTSLEEMYLHMAMIGRVRETFRPFIDSRTPFGSDYTELTIVAYDDPKPGLLAKIAAVLFAHDVNVHSAQVFTRTSSDRIAIDTLWVDFRGKPLSPQKRSDLEGAFRQVLTGEVSVVDLLARRGKPTERVQPVRSLRLDEESSDNYTILDVQAPDVKGVVYRLAAAVSSVGWNIHSARLSTWGGYARDAFYVTDTHNRKVPASDAERLRDLLPQEDEPRLARRRTAASPDRKSPVA
jgi:[protein-PII] uridylyltransferase